MWIEAHNSEGVFELFRRVIVNMDTLSNHHYRWQESILFIDYVFVKSTGVIQFECPSKHCPGNDWPECNAAKH